MTIQLEKDGTSTVCLAAQLRFEKLLLKNTSVTMSFGQMRVEMFDHIALSRP